MSRMDPSYDPLLERTKLPHPSLQRHAVISIFHMLKSAPPTLGLDADAGRHAISFCLCSTAPAVADQAVRELCRIVSEGHFDSSEGLVELQSALEGCDPSFVPLFVKGIGFLCRLAFRSDPHWGRRFDPIGLHPFVKVLSSRAEVQNELIQQVLLFIAHNKSAGMVAVSQFLWPFLMFLIIRIPFSDSSASLARDLISSMTSFSCSFHGEGVHIIKFLTDCLHYFPRKNEKEFKHFIRSAENVVDAIVVLLKQMFDADVGELMSDAQACCMKLLESLLSVCTSLNVPRGGIEALLELIKHLLMAQKEIGVHYLPEFASVSLSMSVILTQVEFEHEHLCILKLLAFLVKWKTESECHAGGDANCLSEDLLYVFPVISLLSSPSKSVKAAASYLLIEVERLIWKLSTEVKKVQIFNAQFRSASTLDSITYRLLTHLWFEEKSPLWHSFAQGFTCKDVFQMKESTNTESKHCSSEPRDVSFWSANWLKSVFAPQSHEDKLAGIPLLITSVVSILIMHPKLGASAVNVLAATNVMIPSLALPMLLAILFYTQMQYRCDSTNSAETLLRLLETVPLLAVHSPMVPLVIQILSPLLQKEVKPTLYAAAIRLLCKAWSVTDRAFETLQGLLDLKTISDFISEREVSISIAASVRDICRHHPDRGVDLILSVSASIESRNSTIQALGFESLAYLCEADLVEFYTAWDVVSKFKLDYTEDPILACGLCTLLQWGAVDAEAYPEASKYIVQILWDVATSKKPSVSVWVKARISAFNSLSFYEIMHVQEALLDFKRRNMECLISEDNVEVLGAMKNFEVKIMNFEHVNRRRVPVEKRAMINKVEKILQVFPQVIFSTGKQRTSTSELPGAALLSFVFTPKDFQIQDGAPRDLPKLHAAYENALMEIAESLNLSRNIVFALLAIQSWQHFMHRWMKAAVMLIDKLPPSVSEKSSKTANDMLKVMCTIAAQSIPRVAVNIALAIGALCLVAPPSAHSAVSAASKFLLNWLFEYQHEYQQWSAAISLGLISNCFHVTDRQHKFEVITGLLKVLGNSKSHLVKGACGVGLGFACQGLLSRAQADENSYFKESNYGLKEEALLQEIIRTFSLMITQLCPLASDSLKGLNEYFPPDENDALGDQDFVLRHEYCHNLEEDLWGVAGLVLGLGYSIIALYRFGAHDAVLKIRDMLISWIPHTSKIYQNLNNETFEILLSIGSCIVLPTVMAFCNRVELMDNDLEVLNSYNLLISHLVILQKTGTLYENLLMASCIGAGSFLSYVINDGAHSIRFDDVKSLLEILRSAYSCPHSPIVHLGGMLGVVNAFGACAADLTKMHPQPASLHVKNDRQELSFIRGPLLLSPICESLATSIVQEMVLLAKDSKDQQIRCYAAWAIAFLREQWWSKELQSSAGSQSSTKSSSQSFAEDSLVWRLSLWLRDNDYLQEAEMLNPVTIATVLQCLTKAPRLPAMDWGSIIRGCMRYAAKAWGIFHMLDMPKTLREECLHFSIAHASTVSPLLLLLDELTDLPRFRTLELNLQQTLLQHLSDILHLFSGSRLDKLLDDMAEYLSLLSSSYLVHELNQTSLLRISFWIGIQPCLSEAAIGSACLSKIEKCMECLFCLLPVLTTDDTTGTSQLNAEEEWLEAMRCLAKARKGWLMGLLQVSDVDFLHKESPSVKVARQTLSKARLVRIGCIPVSELGKLKAYILNARSNDIWWHILVEVAAAVANETIDIKRQWLLDALEISCISEYPSTVLRFIGLLSSTCCKLMPLLIVEPFTIMSDLPVTLPFLLIDSNWSASAMSIADKLWASTERICIWASQLNNKEGGSRHNPIDGSEAHISVFLAQIMHQTCLLLKDYLPFDKQLRLANILVP